MVELQTISISFLKFIYHSSCMWKASFVDRSYGAYIWGKSGSSTSVESYFKDLKSKLLTKGECLRVDNFLINHIKLNDGSLKISRPTQMF